MRDAGLERAIDAAGGVAQLARKIGLAQPSVSNWNRVPAERVIVVEAATAVSRKRASSRSLWRVRFGRSCCVVMLLAPRNTRCSLALLLSAPSPALLERIAQLRDDATPLGRAHANLAEAASASRRSRRRTRIL